MKHNFDSEDAPRNCSVCLYYQTREEYFREAHYSIYNYCPGPVGEMTQEAYNQKIADAKYAGFKEGVRRLTNSLYSKAQDYPPSK